MKEIEDQFLNFPSTLVHDDAPDVLAFLPQLAGSQVFRRFAHVEEEDYWQPQDARLGF
jgi:hypothetical protein